MKFLYVAPRYHTNQMDIMKGLTEHGHEVRFISHYAAVIEDYSCVTPIVLGYSRLYRLIDFLYVKVIHRKDPAAIVFKIQHGFPPVRKLKKLIYGFAPDLVILRERSVYSMAAYYICRKKGYPCILYNQNPLWSEPAKTDLKHRLVDRMTPPLRMTPVMGEKKPGMTVKENDYFVPFVVDPCRAPGERTYFADGRIHILCIGKYEIRKHHLELLRAVEQLRDKYEIRLTLVGEATNRFQKEYCEQVKKSGYREDECAKARHGAGVSGGGSLRDPKYAGDGVGITVGGYELFAAGNLQRYERYGVLCGGRRDGVSFPGLR